MASRILLTLCLAVLFCSPAWAQNCSDIVQNGNETDVDCGGNQCRRCEESEKCLQDSDCRVRKGGCAFNGVVSPGTSGKCFDTSEALRFQFVLSGLLGMCFILGVLHFTCEFKSQCGSCWSNYTRKKKKKKQAAARQKEAEAKALQLEAEHTRMKAEAIGRVALHNSDDIELSLLRPSQSSATDLDGAIDGGTSAPDAMSIPKKKGGRSASVNIHSFSQEDFIRKGTEMHDKSLDLRRQFLQDLVKINIQAKSFVGRVRQDAAILNASNTILQAERIEASTKFRLLSISMLKKGGFLYLSTEEVQAVIQRAFNIIACLQRAFDQPDKIKASRMDFRHAIEETTQIADLIASPRADAMAGRATNMLHWDLTDPRFLVLQIEVESELESQDDRVKRIKEKIMLAGATFISAKNVKRLASRRSGLSKLIHAFIDFVLPGWARSYPYFYFVFFAGMVAVFLRFFLQTRINDPDMEITGTFLPVPAYYQLDKFREQRAAIPLLYGLMHCALYCFCWLPLPFARGLWRDIVRVFPRVRSVIPIDDFQFFHKFLGILTMTFIFLGATIYFTDLGDRCREKKDIQSCRAFDALPDDGIRDKSFTYNPYVNVVALRRLVLCSWFPILPMLHWVHAKPPRCLPNILRQYWFEFLYYGHHLVAHLSVVTALICRFEVFYPALLPWGLYYLDIIRETIMHTYNTELVIRPVMQEAEEEETQQSSMIHADKTGRPVLLRLLIEVPPGFEIGAGQIVYLKVPEISSVEWHPFSIASGRYDKFLELQIGVIGDKDQWIQRDTKLPAPYQSFRKSMLNPVIPQPRWEMVRPTFTYKLQHLMRQRITELAFLDDPERQADEVDPIRLSIRGPYGSAFTKCFSPHYSGCVIIGAGTGLTAALSVLRDLIERKKRKERVPHYVWFVWSCRRVDDLLWAWDTLNTMLVQAVKDDVIKPGPRWSQKSNMVDWLGVTIYVTQSDQNMLSELMHTERVAAAVSDEVKQPEKDDEEESSDDDHEGPLMKRLLTNHTFVQNKAKLTMAQELMSWLSNEKHLLCKSMDDPDTHIGKLLAWARIYLDRKMGRHKKMTVSFCGPPGLAHTIAKSARDIGSGIEFSADHQ